ncbi:TPA: hypothetical protein UM365_000563 [Stenotrophomonas maltophilia]|nr:hypothetical protein [Stenotrophomonas maltophilia]
MNPWPLADLQTEITIQRVFHPRDLANSLNPLDHPWNFDSAMVAKHRLRCITRADREACNDGKWVASRRRPDLWDVLIVGSELYLHGKRVESEADVARFFKPRYRWERRR